MMTGCRTTPASMRLNWVPEGTRTDADLEEVSISGIYAAEFRRVDAILKEGGRLINFMTHQIEGKN